MSYSTYAQPFKIPDGFPELLAELTTEILREQPEDATGIYKFAYEFFLRKQQGFDQPATLEAHPDEENQPATLEAHPDEENQPATLEAHPDEQENQPATLEDHQEVQEEEEVPEDQ